MSAPLLELRHVSKSFVTRRTPWQRQTFTAVDDVCLQVSHGETVGVVGESGSGKTTLARLAINLMKPSEGHILFEGRPVASMSPRALRDVRRRVQPIFQDPSSSLNPRHAVGSIIRAPLDVHRIGTASEQRAAVVEMLERVGLRESYVGRYPHQLSGGERQRVAIARALILRPALIVADEPTSALDVSIQAQVLRLLWSIRDEFGLAYLFISHNLAVVKHLSDWVAVMYLGRIVEFGRREQVFGDPQHPYTRALLASVPIADPRQRRDRPALSGDLPSAMHLPSGCRFRSRCPSAFARCAVEDPVDYEPVPGHRVACYLADLQPTYRSDQHPPRQDSASESLNSGHFLASGVVDNSDDSRGCTTRPNGRHDPLRSSNA